MGHSRLWWTGVVTFVCLVLGCSPGTQSIVNLDGSATFAVNPSDATASGSSSELSVTTEGNGVIKVSGPAGSYTLTFQKSGYRDTTVAISLTSGETRSISVSLQAVVVNTSVFGLQYWPSGGVPLSGLQVHLSSGSFDTLLPISSSGAVSLTMAPTIVARMGSSVHVLADAVTGSARIFFPSDTTLSQAPLLAGQTLNAVMVPISTTFSCGTFAGTTVTRSINKAEQLAGDGTWFYMNFDQGLPWFWKQTALGQITIPVGFDEDGVDIHNVPYIHISDSAKTAAMAVLRDMESRFCDLGLHFTPSTKAAIATTGGTLLSVDSAFPYGTAVGGAGGGGVIPFFKYGVITAQNEGILTRGGLEHEMIHVLGLGGHTCSWPTVMFTDCELINIFGQNRDFPTAEDVAYVKLYYDVRQAEIDHGAVIGLASAKLGERTVMLGLSASILSKNFLLSPTKAPTVFPNAHSWLWFQN